MECAVTFHHVFTLSLLPHKTHLIADTTKFPLVNFFLRQKERERERGKIKNWHNRQGKKFMSYLVSVVYSTIMLHMSVFFLVEKKKNKILNRPVSSSSIWFCRFDEWFIFYVVGNSIFKILFQNRTKNCPEKWLYASVPNVCFLLHRNDSLERSFEVSLKPNAHKTDDA